MDYENFVDPVLAFLGVGEQFFQLHLVFRDLTLQVALPYAVKEVLKVGHLLPFNSDFLQLRLETILPEVDFLLDVLVVTHQLADPRLTLP